MRLILDEESKPDLWSYIFINQSTEIYSVLGLFLLSHFINFLYIRAQFGIENDLIICLTFIYHA